ncbi:hypothetical protein NQD34_004187 [Periophthalmus magnuspinnatus]|nr:hypothetical protein NQD34_004187 [Periophthalmus magnuspinnatus]
MESVVQTVGALEAVVLRAFGPHGGQVLFTRDTGQAMLSRSGARILTALRLDNPLARIIVECASRHSVRTGDGSKSFILLLASLVRKIECTVCTDQKGSLSYTSRACSRARRLADELLSFSLHHLDDLLAVGVLPYTQSLMWEEVHAALPSLVQKLLSAFFHTRLSHNHCSFISRLLCEFLSNWTAKDNQPYSSLQFLNETWPALYTPVVGFPIDYSQLLEGQVIHRDFAMPSMLTALGPVKAIILTTSLHSKFIQTGETLEIKDKGNITHFSSSAESSLECVISNLCSLGVSVLLSSVKQSAAVLALAAQMQISVVECISQEDLALFRHLSEATAVCDFWNIQSEHVVSLAFCKPVLLGAHRYVHVGFPDKQDLKPCSLVICGAGEGQTEQHVSAMQDAVRMLLITQQPPASAQPEKNSSIAPKHPPSPHNCVLTAGGTFEFLLSHALQNNSVPRHTDMISSFLADSLLCLPRHIYSHKPLHFVQIQSKVVKCTHTCPMGSESSINLASECYALEPGLESVFCKYQLLLAVLQCVSQLFRIDSVIHTCSRLKTIANISCKEEEREEEEEQAED